MNKLYKLLSNSSDEAYREALTVIEETIKKGMQTSLVLETLIEIFNYPDSDILIKCRIIKICGSIENSSVISFIKKALNDNNFKVRRTAALTLKLLTNEDYFDRIYRSEIGTTYKRSFWCQFDFLDDKVRQEQENNNKKVLEGFSHIFKQMSENWSYPDPGKSSYFSQIRYKNPQMTEDGRILFKNFNYYLSKILQAGKTFLFLLDRMTHVIQAENGEQEELEDILRCMKISAGTQLKTLDEGISGFIASAHYLRSELDICLLPTKYHTLKDPSTELSERDLEFLNIMKKGFEKFDSLQPSGCPEKEAVLINMIQLRKRIPELFALFSALTKKGSISQEELILFRQAGIIAHCAGIYSLHLLSSWCRDE